MKKNCQKIILKGYYGHCCETGESTKKNLNFEKKNTFQNLKCIFESRNPFIMVNI